ncbi:hypothetical protein LJC15_01405 [Desulfovibrio sp. OttesenSCG-928-G11]|nr:hypothetical protein [Desulfovibrio sp. OttesenSCG-928-G11]
MAKKKTRERERSYQFSDEALEVLEAAKANWKLSEFVSQCVVEHGRTLLGGKAPNKAPTIEDRLLYIEAATDDMLFEKLSKVLETPRIATAFKKEIEDFDEIVWYNMKDIKRLYRSANRRIHLGSPITDMLLHEWQALIKMKKRLLKE